MRAPLRRRRPSVGRWGSLPDVELLVLTVLLAATAALWVSARAAVTVCVLEVRAGTLRVVRGGLAPRVRSDIEDIVARPPLERATLRLVRRGGRAELEVKGTVSDAQRQRLRNVVGTVPLAQLANAPRR